MLSIWIWVAGLLWTTLQDKNIQWNKSSGNLQLSKSLKLTPSKSKIQNALTACTCRSWVMPPLGFDPENLALLLTYSAKLSNLEYREKTTPSQIFLPCNLSSCGKDSCQWQHFWDVFYFERKRPKMCIKPWGQYHNKDM